MSVAILLITLGGWLIYSSLKGQSLVESLTGKGGDLLNPKGGKLLDMGGGEFSSPPISADTGGGTNKYGFKGPNAANLASITNTAISKYNLKVSQVCRPQNANYGAANSLHKQCRAVDLTGAVGDKVAFARYAKSLSWVDEVFCDQAGMSVPGYEHLSHVHVGA